MAQPIAPEVWQQGIEDNALLPSRYVPSMFTGNGVKIANNGEACRVYDIQIGDYITDYDDRRINGLLYKNGDNTVQNQDGRDGWGASAYGVFQDVRFDSRVYTMGRHRSVAMRIFDEMQYSGPIGTWGTETTSNVVTNGQNLMKTAALISKAKELWEKQVLGPDIDKYSLFAILNGHISGRWVADNPDQVMEADASKGKWIAQPGTVQGQAIPPRFAPIHAIEWAEEALPLMLQNIKVAWNNMMLPEDNRCIYIDPYYEYQLLSALTGSGVPATDSAYRDMQNGSFTHLMGWDFDFSVPSTYWPKLYFDVNNNVVHSEDGSLACDKFINSVSGGTGDDALLTELIASDRMKRNNYIRTVWDGTNKKFVKKLTNYPLGQPAASPKWGEAVTVSETADTAYGLPTAYPWSEPGSGYGLSNPTGPVFDSTGKASIKQVIGVALYRPAGQLSQEYSEMRTAEGETRGKFTEMVTDVKYDAWCIERYSHGILPIVNSTVTAHTYSVPVEVTNKVTTTVDGTVTTAASA